MASRRRWVLLAASEKVTHLYHHKRLHPSTSSHTHKIPSTSTISYPIYCISLHFHYYAWLWIPLNTSITLAALHIMIYMYYLSIFLSFPGEYPRETNLLFLSFISPHVLFNYPVNGLRSTRTFSQLLNIPTVG